MKNYTLYILNAVTILILLGCGVTEETTSTIEELPIAEENSDYSYLALGDSYTIGESVCNTCRFPIQLENALEQLTNKSVHTDIIATTGWRTDNLIKAIEDQNPDKTYDFVTLLIGVNNQFQRTPFSVYESEFPQLLTTAITLAQGKKERVIIVSIPDYAFTPYGQTTSNPQQISDELDKYNAHAKEVAEKRGVKFLNITDITRRGIAEPNLVASDGLHPSEDAYAEFVDRLLPIVNTIIKD
ncbi:lysophospholipase L1-like esterase [Leeuwenhoekiella aestuarii]|uniref:Lysophospholipase L1-like esterase n=1 Tax=Leeuwenhoekiella aestuarii TaxID=2249426 RepID=A0A4Q0NZ59_9FLAO|nr:SGNH/GDSL hydrolase family protein [Leeuwenhoekiella aestuarii]RXG18253.1 lysophospholipase L1-like esterase [Leeuwenhoekiella aestuarii]RXG19558.1 lysophospholipase L1-like esterase [Leeuwenhoekiella aestuarii]